MDKKVRQEIVKKLIVHMTVEGRHGEGYKNVWKKMCDFGEFLMVTQEEFDLAWTLAKLKG